MSLADLPDVLIAHLCFYLEYPDICNLMETSKKNYNAIKCYRKNKLELERICCYSEPDKEGNVYKYWANDRKNNSYYSDSHYHNTIHLDINLILEQCSSVDRLHFLEAPMCDITAKVILATNTKIGLLSSNEGFVGADADDFNVLCKKFNFKLYSTELNKKLWNDQVFVNAMPYFTFEYNSHPDFLKIDLTDRTLEAITSNQKDTFDLNGTVNKFTVKGVLNAIKSIQETGNRHVFWMFGELLPEQLEEARRVFNGENEELRNTCIILERENRYRVIYKIWISPDGGVNNAIALVKFSVSKEQID